MRELEQKRAGERESYNVGVRVCVGVLEIVCVCSSECVRERQKEGERKKCVRVVLLDFPIKFRFSPFLFPSRLNRI